MIEWSLFVKPWVPFNKGCLVTNSVKIGPEVLAKKIFKICQCIFAISCLSPLGKGCGPSLEQTWIPFTQGWLSPTLVKIGLLIPEKKILNFFNVFFFFRNYLPLQKRMDLHLYKLKSPLPKDALCQVWLQLAQWFLRKRRKCEKFTDRQMDRQTHDKWSESFHEFSAQMS